MYEESLKGEDAPPTSTHSHLELLPSGRLSPSLAWVLDVAQKTENLDSEPRSFAQRSSPFIPTPPSLQRNPPQSQPLSRQSTEFSIESTSSFSSLDWPSSLFDLNASSTSLNLNVTNAGDDSDRVVQLKHILDLVQEISDLCRICWVHKEAIVRPHKMFCCSTKICSNSDWQEFRTNL